MNDFWRLFLTMLAAVNPPAAALAAWPLLRAMPSRDRATALAIAGALMFALAILGAVFAEDLLDALDIAPESFRIAAGVVLIATGTHAVWRGRVAMAPGDPNWRAGISPLGISTLASPALIMAALSHGADDSAGQVIGAVAVAGAVALALMAYRNDRLTAALDGVARLLGALLVALAVALIVDGVRDI